MTTNDLTFLLIFIVLPTAVIVSGFWAVLFVRRAPERGSGPRGKRRRRRGASGDDATMADRRDERVADDEAVATAGFVPTVTPGDQISDPDEIDHSVPEGSDHDHRPGTTDEPAPALAGEEQLLTEPTAEIPAVDQPEGRDDPGDAAAATRDQPTYGAREQPADAEDQTPDHSEAGSQWVGEKPATSELVEPQPGDGGEQEAGEEAGPEPGRAGDDRSQSGARRTRGESGRSKPPRRSRNSGRQVPRLGRRSNRRHQRGVEGGDGPSDI